jgi:competence protein ComEA
MVCSTPRPLWGWTAPVRYWLTLAGSLVALGLFALARGGNGATDDPARAAPQLVVDPNTARPEVLATLPRLGPALVGRIIAARGQAPFRSLDDLGSRVRGIGPATLEPLRPYFRFDAPESETATARVPGPPPVHLARTF